MGVVLFAALFGMVIAFPIVLLGAWVRTKTYDKLNECIAERDRRKIENE